MIFFYDFLKMIFLMKIYVFFNDFFFKRFVLCFFYDFLKCFLCFMKQYVFFNDFFDFFLIFFMFLFFIFLYFMKKLFFFYEKYI